MKYSDTKTLPNTKEHAFCIQIDEFRQQVESIKYIRVIFVQNKMFLVNVLQAILQTKIQLLQYKLGIDTFTTMPVCSDAL